MPDFDHSEPAVRSAAAIWRAGLDAVRPEKLVTQALVKRILPDAVRGRIAVVGCGKASVSLFRALTSVLGADPLYADKRISGVVTASRGYSPRTATDPTSSVEIVEAGHPLPDEGSVAAVNATKEFLAAFEPTPDDLIVALISGGGSASWGAPISGVSQRETNEFVSRCIGSGADIHEINSVRRVLFEFGAGGLLQYTGRAPVVGLILSDVTGDDMSVVASGPTFPTFDQEFAFDVMRRYDASSRIVSAVGRRCRTLRHAATESVDLRNVRLGDNGVAVTAAVEYAKQLGLSVLPVFELSGEASVRGGEFARAFLDQAQDKPYVLIGGGETTVRVAGDGVGGRNQEFFLGALRQLQETTRQFGLVSAGTDGIDGPTDAAGGIGGRELVARIRAGGLSIDEALLNNDSNSLLRACNGVFSTGPTETNVMDLAVLTSA